MNNIEVLHNYRMRLHEKFSNFSHKCFLRAAEKLITNFRGALSSPIMTAMFALTYDCQCSCSHCGVEHYTQKERCELSYEQIIKVLSEIKKLPSLFTEVNFFGGEPFLRKEVIDIIRYASQSGLLVSLDTNGLLLADRALVKKLKSSGLNHIYVSLDAGDSKQHDLSRGILGCFNKALLGIKCCIEEGLACTISTYVSRNIVQKRELQSIVSLGKQIGVTSIRLIMPILAGRLFNETGQLLTQDEQKQVKELLEPGFVYLESASTCHRTIKSSCAFLGKKLFYISPYGDIQPCCFIPLSLGNILHEDLISILKRMSKISINYNQEDCIVNSFSFRKKYFTEDGNSSKLVLMS